MSSTPGGNVERLQNAGLIKEGSLPDSYREVFEGLDEEEVRVLERVKGRVDQAEATHKVEHPNHSASECVIPL